MGTKEFKVGDKVRWADEWVHSKFSKDLTYTVEEVTHDFLYMEEVTGGWYRSRFEKVESYDVHQLREMGALQDKRNGFKCVYAACDTWTVGKVYESVHTPNQYVEWRLASDYAPQASSLSKFEIVEDWNASEADVKDEEILAKVAKVAKVAAANSVEGIVTKPAHYTRWKIEPVEFLLKNDVPGHIFNIVKYAMRAGYKLYPGKNEVESEIIDLKKSARYIEMRINLLEGKEVL